MKRCLTTVECTVKKMLKNESFYMLEIVNTTRG